MRRNLRERLNTNSAATFADAIGYVKLGDVLSPRTVVIEQAPARTIVMQRPALVVQSCRVVKGAGRLGNRLVTDHLAPPDDMFVALSQDGKTLTFDADVERVVLRLVLGSDGDLEQYA